MIKLLIFGSPCTKWSIAQSKNREVEPSGIGWELFKNGLIAKEKFQPDFFLYENNVSAAPAIKEQIRKEFGVVDNPIDEHAPRYIEINSALVSAQKRKRFYVHNCGDVGQPKDRHILLEDILDDGENLLCVEKAHCLLATYFKASPSNTIKKNQRDMVAVAVGYRNRREDDGQLYRRFETQNDVKANALTTVETDSMVAVIQRKHGDWKGGLKYGKSPTMTSMFWEQNNHLILPGKEKEVYEVKDGFITIKDKKYKTKLKDGLYYIRKFTTTECERLQTMPEGYTRAVSNTQAYRALGNGWTAEVIIHILNGALKDVPRDEKIVVLSMYDGIATGRYCLDKIGFKNVEYHAYEINKFPIKVAMSNYTDIIQHGDAFAVREDGWHL